jgi:hypothetical protein
MVLLEQGEPLQFGVGLGEGEHRRVAYLRDTLPGLFALGEKPTTEQLLDWLPDRWLLNRTRNTSIAPATAG